MNHSDEEVCAILSEMIYNIRTELPATKADIDLDQPGYPTQTIGAGPPQSQQMQDCRHPECAQLRPCPSHDGDPVYLNSVERAAMRPNPAQRDKDEIHQRLLKAYVILRPVAAITARRSRTVHSQHRYCQNCSTFRSPGELTEIGRTECQFCRKFRAEYGVAATKAIWAARDARGGQLDPQTIKRILGSSTKSLTYST